MTGSPARVQVGYLAGEATAAEVRALEALGVDSLWTAGHIASDADVTESITGLTRLAVLTERVTVGTAVLLLPLYPAAVVAKQVAEVDRMSEGRVALGIGVGGEYPEEFAACGVPVEERGRRTNEAVVALRMLWRGGPARFQGRYSAFKDVAICPPPARPGGPPILIGGRSKAAALRAARLADGWLPFLLTPGRYREQAQVITDEAAAAGRDLRNFTWMHEVPVALGTDTDRAIADACAAMAGRGHPMPAAVFAKVGAAGRPEQIAERLQEFVDAGVRHLVLAAMPLTRTVEVAEAIRASVVPMLSVPDAYSSAHLDVPAEAQLGPHDRYGLPRLG